ncbi:3-isopropylmalate dehydrogenase [Tichowtungia aerotolerans]|uniref:3-isopropylmalate dehydrogenase n=1 Tax=Tichowtungia aerotolerans TaxID=2697043 RepID=A0A6P1MC46_9BACT|nr:3-isopropylmalate dehydrogenase [Tichowtungia aerotolerans]QHI68665.1 3-isopropylmalate dehydrogenase [Tichowtungia aerotolerans]
MSKTYKITLLPGDGIGPEVVAESVKLLDVIAEKSDFSFEYTEALAGGAAIDARNDPMPQETIDACKASDAVLLGAVGGPKWDDLTGAMRPESGLLKIRKELAVFANLRPVAVPPSLAESSPLRPAAVIGVDLLTVRELTGGIYFGQPVGNDGNEAFNTMRYSVEEIERVARVAFEWARKRRNKVTSVDKANVLEVSRLWRDTVKALHKKEFSDVELDHMYIDNATMQMVINPRQFDVILTGNIFGDILSDTSATLGGSLGLLPSASLGKGTGLFEPVHGSAPDIAGQGKANPIAMILSTAMMLDDLGEGKAATAVRQGLEAALGHNLRTADLCHEGYTPASTSEMGELIRTETLRHL